MGNTNSQSQKKTNDPIIQNTSYPEIVPSQLQPKQPTNHYEALIALRVLIQNVLKQFEKEGEDMKQFTKQFKNRNIKRGQNFQGVIDQKGEVVGIAKYFQIKDNQYQIFMGICNNRKPFGRGISINGKLMVSSVGRQSINTKVNKDDYTAILLQNWQNKQRMGAIIKKTQKGSYFYKGNFTQMSIKRGKLYVREHDAVQMQYEGQFQNENMHGKGVLLIPGKYKYDGYFKHQYKHGIGQEIDLTRQTYYIGQFQNNKRNGYGQLTYRNRDNAKLKGFWVDGIMKAGDGVYVSQDGNFLQVIGDDIQLI